MRCQRGRGEGAGSGPACADSAAGRGAVSRSAVVMRDTT